MEREIKKTAIFPDGGIPQRYICIKMLEGDHEVERRTRELPLNEQIFARRDKEQAYIGKLLREDPESAFTNARYGFIAGGLQETLTEKGQKTDKTKLLDSILTHRYLGFPLFFLFLWVMFEATFRLGGLSNGVDRMAGGPTG